MKKFLVVILLIALVSSIVGCSQTVAHQHTFDSPTCLKPATCADCGEIKGTTVDHDTTNGKCSMCGLDYYKTLKDMIEISACTKNKFHNQIVCKPCRNLCIYEFCCNFALTMGIAEVDIFSTWLVLASEASLCMVLSLFLAHSFLNNNM